MLLLVMFIACSYASEPCPVDHSVDISDGVFIGGKVLHDGVEYPSDIVFKRNVSGAGVIRTLGCICKIKNCFRKCCPLGQVMYGKQCTEMKEKDRISVVGLDLHYDTTYRRTASVKDSGFGFIYGKPCRSGLYMEDEKPLYVQEDGTLYLNIPDKERSLSFTIYSPDKFCIDTFINDLQPDPDGTVLNALVCVPQQNENNHYILSSTCMLISCFFILLTVGVYSWLPELRNLHGMILMAYLLSFFVAFLSMTTMQILILEDKHSPLSCVIISFFIYFFLLAAFFWLNVMCYDIWYTFSGKRGTTVASSARSRFLKYCAYALGMPTLLTVILAALEFSDVPLSVPYMPRLRRHGCFLYKMSRLIYLYGPITILCVTNFIFFMLTAIKIAMIKQQTKQILKSNESSTHDQHKKDKQRLSVYVKLFAVMGFNWILEVVSSFFPEANKFWQFTDAYNVLVGLIIFVIFVCKKKTWRKLKNRYRVMRGIPMTRTQTTTSTSTHTISSQSRDSIHMNSINKTETRT